MSKVPHIVQAVQPNPHTEGPHWSTNEQALYFIDINGHSVHRFHPKTNLYSKLVLQDSCNIVIPINGKPGKYVIGYGRNISALKWDYKTGKYSIKTIFSVEDDKFDNRFNDGKADANGRLWIGTMSKNITHGAGALYLASSNSELKTVLKSVTVSNGITWSLDNTSMYYTDSTTRRIDVFDYDISTGNATDRRPFFDFEVWNIKGLPDGLTTDRDGNIWVAVCYGGKVLQISKTGKLLYELVIPTDLVSSVAWGGSDLETLYVTTMYDDLDPESKEKQPLAGSVFAVKGLGTGGASGGNEVSPSFDI